MFARLRDICRVGYDHAELFARQKRRASNAMISRSTDFAEAILLKPKLK